VQAHATAASCWIAALCSSIARGVARPFTATQLGIEKNEAEQQCLVRGFALPVSQSGTAVIISRSLKAREARTRVDFVKFVGEFTELRRVGQQFIGICPLHSERNPSLYVHPEKPFFSFVSQSCPAISG
jgi:hypothetical protein